ncbi:hypothetical protein Tco_0051322 [Tanacetum coccineum]
MNYMQQPMSNPEEITDPTTAMNMALVVQNVVQNPSVQNVGNQNGLIVVPGIANHNANHNGNDNRKGHLARNCTVTPRRRDVGYLQTSLLIAQKEEVGIQLQAEEFDLMAVEGDLDEIEEVNANCILMANSQQASSSGTQTNKVSVYDSNGSAEVHHSENCYDSDIFNMFTQEEYMEQSRGTVEQSSATVEETHPYFESLYNNLAIEVEKVNSVNHKMKETNVDLTTELAIYKNKEKCFEINQEKYDKLERAAKFVRDIKSLVKEADESLAKHKALEHEIKRLLRAVVSQDNFVIDTSNPQTELDRMKEKLETCIIKKEKEYVVLWNNWYKKCKECKYDKISYDKAYNEMQQKITRLQAQLGDLKGKSMDTQCASDTLDPLSQKLEDENVSLEFQTKLITDSFQEKLHDTLYENATLRAQLFDKVSEQKDTTKGTSANTKFSNQSTMGKPLLQPLRNHSVVRQPNAFQSERPKFSKTQVPPKVVETNDLSKLVTSNSVPTTKESKVMKNDKVITPRMFRINLFMISRKDKFVPINKAGASIRTNLIIVSQPRVITKQDVNSDSNGLSSTRIDNIAKTRRPQPRSNTKNDRVPSASKSSCIKNKEVEVEEHHRNLLLSKNKKHMSSNCNNIKLAIRNDKS